MHSLDDGKMIIYIDMDDVLCDFSGAYEADLLRNPGIQFPQSQYGFFEELEPIEDAIEIVSLLIESRDYVPYVLTAPSTKNPFSYTGKRIWIEKKFDYSFTKNLIICSNKGLLKGDILIDDNASGKGQENFEGRLMLFGSNEYPNWKAVARALGIWV